MRREFKRSWYVSGTKRSFTSNPLARCPINVSQIACHKKGACFIGSQFETTLAYLAGDSDIQMIGMIANIPYLEFKGFMTKARGASTLDVDAPLSGD